MTSAVICDSHSAHLKPGGEWCTDAATNNVKGLEKSPLLSRLMGARVVSGELSGSRKPWQAGESLDLYEELGLRDFNKKYIVVWINLGVSSMVFVLEFLNDDIDFEHFATDDFMMKQLKFLTNPVSMRGGPACKLPKDADAVGAFFG